MACYSSDNAPQIFAEFPRSCMKYWANVVTVVKQTYGAFLIRSILSQGLNSVKV